LPVSHLLRLSVVPDRDRVVVRAHGELDLSTAELVRTQLQELAASGWSDVVLDLRPLSFMDTAGVHVLLSAQDDASRAQTSFAIIAGEDPVIRVLALTGTRDLLHTLDAARPMGRPDVGEVALGRPAASG
jgi:anti-sigma B factor antagonist